MRGQFLRLFVLLAGGAILAPPSARAAEPLEGVYACAAIKTDAERLACYDAEIGKLKSAEQTGDVAVIDAKRVKELQKESFGFALPSLPKLILPRLGGANTAELSEVSSKIKSVRMGGDQRVVVTLDNGQIWRQTDDTQTWAIKPGADVTIKKATLGSFLMKAAGLSAYVRVHRDE